MGSKLLTMPRSPDSTTAVLDQVSAIPTDGWARQITVHLLVILAGAVLIAGLSFLVYGRALHSRLIFDDKLSLLANPSIDSIWPLIGDADHPGPLNPPPNLPISGRPLTNYTLALNRYFWGSDPFAFHVVNLIIHILASLVLWRLAVRILRMGSVDRAAEWLGLFVAILWAIHPLQTETVIYVTQRTELLATLFYLATLYASVRYFGAKSWPARIGWALLAAIACMLGAASKEVLATAPIAVLLMQWVLARESLRRSWPLYLALMSGWVVLLITQRGSPHSDSAGFHIGIAAHTWWFTQAQMVLTYLKLIIWPHPLLIHYPNRFVTSFATAWPAILAVALLAGIGLALLVRRNSLGLVIALFFLILSPTLIIPNGQEVAAERRMYLPLAAIFLWLVATAYQCGQRWRAAMIPIALVGLGAVISWPIISADRAAVYGDERALWRENLRWAPDDAISHNNLGSALVDASGLQQQGAQYSNVAGGVAPAGVRMDDLNAAMQQFEEAIRLDPTLMKGRKNLANVLETEGRLDEAIAQYRLMLQQRWNAPDVHANLGEALLQNNQPQQAVQELQVAVAQAPTLTDAHNNLGTALLLTGDAHGAIDEYLKAVQGTLVDADLYKNLALAYRAANQPAQAVAAAQKAISIARQTGQNDLANALAEWLQAYRSQPASSQ